MAHNKVPMAVIRKPQSPQLTGGKNQTIKPHFLVPKQEIKYKNKRQNKGKLDFSSTHYLKDVRIFN
jgi:hypothetical protein